MKEGMTPMFSIGYDEKISIPEGMLPADCITDVDTIDINKAFNFFVERVRELERKNLILAEWNAYNDFCPMPKGHLCKYKNGEYCRGVEYAESKHCWAKAASDEDKRRQNSRATKEAGE